MMNKNIYGNCKLNFIAVSFLLLLCSNIFADGEKTASKDSNITSSIYLCTKDLDGPPLESYKTPQNNSKEVRRDNAACNASSLAYNNHNSINGDYIFIPYEDGKECHYFLRHCFLVQAIKKGDIIVNGKKLLNLKYLTSRGFGVTEDGEAVTSAEDIFSYDEYKNQIISCKLVFDKNNLTDGELKMYKSVSRAMDHKWADITSAMEDETYTSYDNYSHNCCTVAYKVLESVNKNIKNIIDPNEINYGIGVLFTGVKGAVSGFVTNSAREFSQKLSNDVVDKVNEAKDCAQKLSSCLSTDGLEKSVKEKEVAEPSSKEAQANAGDDVKKSVDDILKTDCEPPKQEGV